jgi:hypothetical protein
MAEYDLSQVICFLSPDSNAVAVAFKVHEKNHAHRAPKKGSSSAPIFVDPRQEREKTPLFDTFEDTEILEDLAITTSDRKILGGGLTFGSDPFKSDILLDDTNQNGVSAVHFKIYSPFQGNPESATPGDMDSLVIESMSSNPVKVTSEQESHPALVKEMRVKIGGGSWMIRISARIQIAIVLRFPDRGADQADFMTNWRRLHVRECKQQVVDASAGQSSTNPTPQIPGLMYKIHWDTKPLGSGSFGEVRRASDLNGNMAYAAKVFTKTGKAQVEREFLEGFRHVSSSAFRLFYLIYDQKHVVKYHAFIQDRGCDILIMELLPGGTLESRMSQRLHIWDLRRYWYEISLALKYLHSQGMIHRDLKPANVLFDKYDTVKLCDFGLSRQLSAEDSLAMSLCGSPLYMAPEVAKKAGHDQAADIWSLGIIVLGMYGKIPNSDKLRKDGWRNPLVFDSWLKDLREAVASLDQHFQLLQGHLTESPLARRDASSIAEELKTKHKEDVTSRRVTGTTILTKRTHSP